MAFTMTVSELIDADTSGLLGKHSTWERVFLVQVASILNGAPFDSALFSSTEGMPLVRIRDVIAGVTKTYYTGVYDEDFVVRHRDLLIGMDGDFNSGFWGFVPALLNQRVCKISATETFYDQRLLAYVLPGFLAAINANTPSVTVKHLSSKTIGEIDLPLPPRAEQTRIVEKLEELLSDLDAGAAELKAAQKKLVQYRKSLLKAAVEGALSAPWREAQRKLNKPQETGAQLLQRILTERRARWEAKQLAKFAEQGKAPPKDWQKKYLEPVKPDTSELPQLPEGWFLADLETLLPVDKTGTKTGPFGSLLMKHEHRRVGIPVVGIENIAEGTFRLGSKIHIDQAKAYELSEYDLQVNDLVISRSGTVGEICVIPITLGLARFSTNIMRVRLNGTVLLPQFFSIMFSGSPFILNQVSRLCSGSTRDFLNTEILKSLVFPVPPIHEQSAILEFVQEKIREYRALQNNIDISLNQSFAQRKNILKAAFSGQLVPQDPIDEPASELLARICAERAESSIRPAKRTQKPRVSVKA
jgi:type I restriction enzyme, S subunit